MVSGPYSCHGGCHVKKNQHPGKERQRGEASRFHRPGPDPDPDPEIRSGQMRWVFPVTRFSLSS